MAEVRDLERVVKIAAPYDNSVVAEVRVESLPVWFDLGWQRVDGEDYTPYGDYKVAAPDTSPSYDLRTASAPSSALDDNPNL